MAEGEGSEAQQRWQRAHRNTQMALQFKRGMADDTSKFAIFSKNFLKCFLVSEGEDIQAEDKNMYAQEWMNVVEDVIDEFQRVDADEDADLCKVTCQDGKSSCPRCMEKKSHLKRLHLYWSLIIPDMIPGIIDTLGAGSTRFMSCLSVQITTKMIQTYPMFNRLKMRRLQYAGRGLKWGAGEWDDVNEDEGEPGQGGRQPKTRQVYKAAGSYSSREVMLNSDSEASGNESSGEDAEEKRLWDDLAPESPQKRLLDFTAPQKVEIQFYWCGIDSLLEDDQMAFRIVGALCAQSDSAGVFSPVVSQAILKHNWHHCRMFFRLDLAFHVAAIFALAVMTWVVKDGQWTDHGVIIEHWLAVVAIVSFYSFFMHSCLEMLMAFLEFKHIRDSNPYDPRTWFGPYLTMWNLSLMAMELAVCITMAVILHDYWSFDAAEALTPQRAFNSTGLSANGTRLPGFSLKRSFLDQHPIVFALIIGCKWFQLCIGVLALEFFGLTVLPAFYAMKSEESMRFIVFILFVMGAVTHAYYSLPLGSDDYEADSSSLTGMMFVSFVRMFRLCILGDFDLWELEGVDPVVNLTEGLTSPDGTAALDEPDDVYSTGGEKEPIHNAIRGFFMVVVVFTAVMMMNMYIGILGKEYDKFSDRKVQMYAHQKAKFTVRYLLRRRFWLQVSQKLCCCPGLWHGSGLCHRLWQARTAEDKMVWHQHTQEEQLGPDLVDIRDPDAEPRSHWEIENEYCQWEIILAKQMDLQKENALESSGSVMKAKGFWMTIPPDMAPTDDLDDQVNNITDSQMETREEIAAIRQMLKSLADDMK